MWADSLPPLELKNTVATAEVRRTMAYDKLAKPGIFDQSAKEIGFEGRAACGALSGHAVVDQLLAQPRSWGSETHQAGFLCSPLAGLERQPSKEACSALA